MTTKMWIDVKPGDRVDIGTVMPGLSGGSCRSTEKEVVKVSDSEDRLYFKDGTTYNHIDNPDLTIRSVQKTSPFRDPIWLRHLADAKQAAIDRDILCRSLIRDGVDLGDALDQSFEKHPVPPVPMQFWIDGELKWANEHGLIE